MPSHRRVQNSIHRVHNNGNSPKWRDLGRVHVKVLLGKPLGNHGQVPEQCVQTKSTEESLRTALPIMPIQYFRLPEDGADLRDVPIYGINSHNAITKSYPVGRQIHRLLVSDIT